MPTVKWARLGFERFLLTSSRGIFQTLFRLPLTVTRGRFQSGTRSRSVRTRGPQKPLTQNQLRPTTRMVVEKSKEATTWNAMMREITIPEEYLHMPACAGREHDTMLPTSQGTATLWQTISNGTDHLSIKAGLPRTKRHTLEPTPTI